ncbi:peptide synthetase [Sorangium cellulosum]|uniref:Peptide synthetase n=1 Tax=Sorangium cellulosum TaxID=56 RepID=A0A2L0ESQ7_SORCE|nr:non-ribosomal peptide synthetase/type I polyketide synthase [Sorangium cellulosum]AUX42315.1 peptide synthetase [Sorangium cellulosum]
MSRSDVTFRPEDVGTLVDVLKQRAARQPDRTAYIFLADKGRREERLTYAELDREARKMAAFLLGLGAPGDRVVLLYPPGLEYVVAFLGCLYAGMIAVPLYPPRRNQKLFRVQEIFKNASPVAALTCASLYETVSDFLRSEPGYGGVGVYSTTGLPGDGEGDLPEVKAHELAFLQYTSGSTGAPKGVMVGHSNLMANGRGIRGCFRTSEEDVFVSWVPLFHDMGLILNIVEPLYLGALSVMMSPLDFVQSPLRWLEAITKYRGTVAGGPNFAFNLCVEKIAPEKVAALDLRSWRVAYNGAEPIRAETLEHFTRKFAPAGFVHQAFHCCFGMAESTLLVSGGDTTALPVVSAFDKAALAARSARPPERDDSAAVLVGCGSALEGHRMCIVDPGDRRALPDGEVGEIWLAGPSVAGGYWNRPDASRETFEATTASGDGPFLRTGDLGFLHGGDLYVAGRMKDTIILRGRNLYPQDIEAVVSTCHPALKAHSAAAFAVEVEGEEHVVVVQEVARGSKSTAWSEVFPVIHQAVAESHDLGLHAVVLIPTGSLPVTSSGKVQRHAARARYLEGSLDVVASFGALSAERRVDAERREERAESAGPPPAGAPARHDVDHLQEVVLRLVAATLKVSPADLDVSRPLAQYGLSSKAAIALTGDLEGELKIPVSPTLVYDHPTIAALARALAGQDSPAPAPARKAQVAPVRADGRQEPVAIVGIGCRFPGASGPEAFWELLQKGGDAIRELPPERRALLGLREDGEPLWGGYLDGIELFDPEHFGISPREADVIDPQQRLVLEVAQEALHFAGLAPSRLAGSLTGVFMGVSTHDYERLVAGSTTNTFAAAGSAASVVANRLSYTLDLRGPSIVVDTACSSSLVAVHYACRSLESGECDVAIAGGVNVLLDPGVTRALTDGHFMAADGRCKTFDASADGYVRSEGCGVVVLKRLRDAQRDGDPVLAVIRGSAVHQDGRSNGLHAPNGPAQEAVIRAALERAGVAPAQIQYVEAHGTGTALGDPIEFGAIRNVLGRDRAPDARCGVGSVKTNLGHMEAAAGVGGLLKVVHALGHRELPGNLFLRQLNPHISLDGGFYIPAGSVPWEAGGEPRLAGVSSFGFGGTIAHVILEQAPAEAAPREVDLPDARRAPRRPVHLLPLSARSDAALRELAGRCKDHLARHPEVDVADFCHTLAVGRDAHELRLAVGARDAGELCRHLEGYLRGAVTPAVKVGRARRRPRVAFLFSGHGTQYAGMGRALYEALPSVRATIDRCDALVRGHLGASLISVLYPEGEPDGRVHQAQLAQVSLFSLQVALAELLMSWGISPDAVMGHSLGEFAAACAAGVFDLEDGLRLVLERGRLLESVSAGGGMVTVYASEAEVEQYLKSAPALSVAAVNAPRNTLVSGPVDALELLMTRLDSDGVRNRRTNVNLAFHSAMVEPILDEFERVAAAVHHRAPRVLFTSTVTGRRLEGALGARYWRAQLREKVRFTEGLTSLRAAGCEVFVEIGPRQVLTGLADETLGSGVSCFPALKADVPEWETLTEMLAGLHVSGVPVDFERVGRSEGLRRVAGLPSPGLERRRCWFDEGAPRGADGLLAARATTVPAREDRAGSVAPLAAEPAARTAARVSAPPAAAPAPAAAPEGRVAEILEHLRIVVARLLKTSPERLDVDLPLLEMGADSLMLMDALRAVRDQFGVEMTFRQVFDDLHTLSSLASHVDAHMPPPAPAAPAAPPATNGVGAHPATNGAGVHPATNGAGVHPATNGAGVHPATNGAGVHPAPVALVQLPADGIAAVVARIMDQHTQVITMALQLLGAQAAAPVQGPAPQGPAPQGPAPQGPAPQGPAPQGPAPQGPAPAPQGPALAALPGAPAAAASPAVARPPEPPLALPPAGAAGAEAAPALEPPGARAVEATLPLSEAQKQLWFLAQLNPGALAAYVETTALEMQGPLDIDGLRRAVVLLAERHDALRVHIAEDGSHQVVSPRAEVALDVVSCAAATEAEAEAKAARWLADARRVHLDLHRGPLVRFTLLSLNEHRHMLVIDGHHIVVDGLSLAVILEDLAELYSALCEGRAPALAPAPPYGAFAAHEPAYLASARAGVDESFWRTRFPAGIEPTELPTSRPRPDVFTFEGARHEIALDPETWRRLKEAGRQQGCTPFMVLLAGYLLLIARLAGREDVVVGFPVAGRSFEGGERLVGYCTHLAPFRGRVPGDVRFEELLTSVKRDVLDVYEHQELPFAHLLRKLDHRVELNRGAAVSLVFNLNRVNAAVPFSRMRTAAASTPLHHAKFDLLLNVFEAGDTARLHFDYATSLFDEQTIARFARAYVRLLTAGAERPARRLRELPLLSEDELQGLLWGFNQSDRPYPQDRCLHQLFEAQAARTPEQVALVFGSERLTYAELNRRANQLAHHLRRHGVGPDTVVAVVAERSLELVVALYGVLKAGGAYLPIDPTYPAERIRVLLEDAASPVLLTQEKWRSALPETSARVVRLDADWPAVEAESGDDPRPVSGPEHLAYVIYTSGSTGKPKGVENSHRGIVNRLLWMLEDTGLGEQDAVLQKTPYTFDVSVWELFAPLLCGARLVVAAPEGHRDPAYLADVIEAHAITTAHFVPSMLQAFLESLDGRKCRSLRRVICSGEALSRELQERFFRKLGDGEGAPELQNLYGPTEAAVDVTSWRCRRGDPHASVPIGKPVANTRIYLLDGGLQPVPVGMPGELYIGGVQVARGYLKRPALTAERFIPDPFSRTPGARLYRTGDLARFLPDGTILFLGRIDHQVKLRGFRIELGEIEAALLASAEVREAAALLREDRPGDPRLVAYVVPRSGPDVDVEALRRALGLALPSYMVPSDLVALPAMPLTPSGKLDRKALPAPALEPAARGEHVAPSGETEMKLAEIWQEVLGRPRAGATDEFFASGGHSLLATRLVSRVRSVFGVELPLRAVFEAPVLAQLAARIERARTRRGGLDAALTIPLSPRGDAPPPMSFAQERLWFLQQLEPGSPAYNMAAAVRLSGALDHAALQGCLREVVRRHEALRATFATDAEGRGVQRIAPDVALRLPLVDLSGMPEAEREGALARLAREEAERPFDLAEGPLVRGALVRLGATEHVWLLGMHHIVSDDWSVGVFVREVSALYAAYAAGQPSPLPPLPIQYADYAHWQRQTLQGEALERELVYWTRQLAGIPGALELPADRPRPAAQSFRGGEVAVTLPAELAQALRALALRENATLFMTLLAAFQALLGRYSRQSDVVVGSPVAGRTHAEVEGLIGFFVNTLALRADLSGDPPFVELLRQVRDTALGAYAHQAVPFERIVDALGVPRDLSRTPVFQVMFTLQNTPAQALELAGLSLREEEIHTRTAKFDLDLTLRELDGALVGTMQYSAELFDAATAERMAGHLRTLLEGVAAAPATRISRLPLLTDAERRQIVVERNRTARDFTAVRPAWRPEARFTELFEAQVERTPDAVAVECDGERWTYAELDDRARRVGRALRERGVGRDDVVGLLLDRGVALVAAILGVFKAGGAYMPLDAEWPDQRLATALAQSKARAIVCAAPSRGRAGALDAAPALDIAELLGAPPAPRGATPAEGSADDLAYVLFTSGSTGTPKGVMVTHAGMLNQQFAKVVELGLGAGDTMAQTARQTFDISVWQLLNLLLVGGRILILKDEQAWAPRPLLTALSAQRATIFETVPTHLRLLLDELEARPEAYDLSALRWLMPTGEALLPELCERWFRAFPHVPMVNAYGPTECSDDTSLHKLHQAPSRAWKYVPIHGCVANLRNYVLDERLEPVPDGVPGELCIGGVGVGRGYIADPGRTAQAFVPDPFAAAPGARMYRTGDLVRFLADGSIEFLGRIDHQVKIRGFRIELGEIEAALSLHPGVRECVVLMREDGQEEKRLVAYVVPAGDAEGGALARHLQERLPAYMVPSAFVLLDAFPLLSNGKIDRRALPAPAAGVLDAAEQHVAPCTPTEVILAGVWRDLLRVDPVGRFANFFTLGGHSLLATRLVSRVREAFGIELALRAVFEHQTLAELAVAVEQARDLDRADAAGPIEPAPRDGIQPLPLSFAQQRLWFLHQLEEPSDAYNMAGAFRLRGALHVEALGRAYSDILARHETLRTRFPAEAGEPRQVIEPPAAGQVAMIDLSDRGEAEREAALRRLVDQEGASRFDLARGPLVRCRLLRLGPAEHVMQVTLHHIISDGWSVRVFLDELIALYNHYRLGAKGAYPLPELPVQYVDFTRWQRATLQGERLARQLDFWKTQLAGAPLLLSLPTDRPRPALQSMKGAVARFTVDSTLTAELRALGRRFDVTFFMTLFAGFNVLLSRYSGQADLLVGVPVANRTRKEIERLIGFFVNTLVLRSDLSGNPTFDALLRRVRQTTLDAYAHQDLPFEQVVEAVRPERNLSHHPLFQVMFDLQDADDEVMRLEGLEVEPLEPERVTSMFDMSVTLQELDGGLRGTIEYNTDLFADSTIRRLIEHFTTLLRLVAAAPHRRVGELEMLGAGELAAVKASWEVAPPPALAADPRRDVCVHQLIARRAAEDPGATALSSGDRHVSYGEMNTRAVALARHLRALGVGPEVLVGLCAEDGIALVTGVIAVLMAGGAYLCLDPGHPKERLAEILSDARPSVLLCGERDVAALPAQGAAVVTLDGFLEGSAPAGEVAPAPTPCSPDNAAYVVYTSGTTGKPKGVTVTHRALVNDVLAWEHEFHLAGGPACHLQMASSAFDVFSGEVLRALCSGGRLVFCPRGLLVEPDKLHALMRRERVDCADFIPAVLRALSDHLEETGQDLGFMKLVVVGSDVWTAEDHARFRALCGPSTRLINAYGVSEATIDSTWFEAQRLELDADRSVPIGRPMPGVRALVLDAHLMPVPAGVPGELFLGGLGVARGYLNRPGHTAERFIPDPFARTPGERLYRTGDLARLLPDGNLALLGRADHQVKIRGFRVEPDEIAAVVAAYPGVREAVVVVREERPGEKRLVACLTAGDGAPPPRADDVKRFLRDKLPHYMVPSAIEVLDAMPLTQNRKIDRAALARRRSEAAGASSADAPRTPAEELLAGVFRDVLGVETVRRSDSFFDLGGHSLLATQLASRASKVFGRELPLRVIFEEPVLASLADYMQRAERRRQAPPLQRASRERPLPLSFSQEQLWTAAQLAPDGGAYNMSGGLRVRGALDVDAVRAALAEIARRHEILRMRVETVDGRPVMAVSDEFPLAVVVEDLQGIHGREAREAELMRRFEAEVSAPFDLSRAPLVRLRIFRLAAEETVLAFTLHHLLCDGWSLSVLVRELVACYEALAAGRPHDLPELPLQYADLAAWQRKWMSGEVLEQHREHFARRLGGELPVLVLPLDRPRARRRSDAGARLVQPLDGELARALAELGRRAGATLNMTLMAGFLALLYRFSRQDDLLLGMTVAGRSQAEAEPLIGCFINNVVLRFDLSARPSYRDLLAQVRRETLEAYEHQALPFEKLIEALNPPREPGVTPFFQVVFGVQNTPPSELSIPGLAIEELPPGRETARYDLTVWVHEAPGALSVEWTYSTDLFEAATIREMARGYEEVLRRVVSDPDIGLLALSSSKDSETTRGQGASKQAALKEKLLGARRQAKRIDLSE